MAKKFADIKTTAGARVMLNLDCTAYVTATHGTNMADGAEVVLMTLNEEGFKQVSVPASQVEKLLKSINALGDQFVKVAAIGGGELFLNTMFISSIDPLHGNDFSDGAAVNVMSSVVQVSSSSALDLINLVV
ncbi:hypothetical protein [Roseateles sp. BYS87W]|uniref:Uncharacterized protein n=1 Tax=Pelomonas baiyunensis TaxID=3299026 RepID=A0ABW7H2C8_9BURK